MICASKWILSFASFSFCFSFLALVSLSLLSHYFLISINRNSRNGCSSKINNNDYVASEFCVAVFFVSSHRNAMLVWFSFSLLIYNSERVCTHTCSTDTMSSPACLFDRPTSVRYVSKNCGCVNITHSRTHRPDCNITHTQSSQLCRLHEI